MLVLVHGVPETADVWDEFVETLDHPEPVVRLSPPGFGAPVPEGFSPTMDGYRQWLIGELEKLDGPVDLVGHDWGGAHVANAATARPDLVRCWVSDLTGAFHPEYEWHDIAQIWQTADVGEEFVAAQQDASDEDRVAALVAVGMSSNGAAKIVANSVPKLGECILGLYRSAAQPKMAEAGEWVMANNQVPALVLVANDDQFVGGLELAGPVAERLGADVSVLEGQGHWWMHHAPELGADAVREFLAKHR